MGFTAISLMMTSLFFLLLYIGHTFSRILHRNPNPVAIILRMAFYLVMSFAFFVFIVAFFDYAQIEWQRGVLGLLLYVGYFILLFICDKALLRRILERMDPRLDQVPRTKIKIER